MEYKCGVCGNTVGEDLITFKEHTDAHIIDLVKEEHPHWVDNNGICKKCESYYQKQISGE